MLAGKVRRFSPLYFCGTRYTRNKQMMANLLFSKFNCSKRAASDTVTLAP
jgi:hypothetical protein